MLNVQSIRSIKRSGPEKMQVLAFITDICNYDCWYCYVNKKEPNKQQSLDLDVLFQYLTSFHHVVSKPIELELIGGEPSCHPNILSFSETLYKCNINITYCMYTNFSQKLSKYKSLAANGMRFDITVHNTGNSLSDRYVIENIMSIQTSSIREITVMLDKSKFDIGV